MDKRKKIIMCIIAVLLVLIITIPFAFADTPKIRKNVIKINQTTNTVTEEEKDEEIKEYKNYYFLGDSRSVGMSYIDTNKNHFYTAKVDEGYKYFLDNYKSVIEKSTKDDAIVINFGVNDLHNADKYVELINKMETETNSDIYFLTVNPVDEEKEAKNGYKIKNSDIDAFNKKLKENLNSNIKVIDSNSVLKKEGFDTVDGIHFTNNTYSKILEIATSN